MNAAIHRNENFHNWIDKMTIFENGVLPSIQTIVACFRKAKMCRRLSYIELVQYAQDGGESHGANIASLRVDKIVNTYPNDQVVNSLEPGTSDRQSVGDGEQLNANDNSTIPTD